MRMFEAYANVYHMTPRQPPEPRPAPGGVRRHLASRHLRPSARNGTWGDPL
jgi:hypothetical protein